LIAKPIDVADMLGKIARFLPQPARRPAPAAAPGDAALPVFRIEPLVALARGNQAHLGSLVRVVQQTVNAGTLEFDRAHQLWQAGQAGDAGRILHSMRGGIGSLGAKRFAAISLALEASLKADDAAAAAQFLQAREELEALLQAAGVWLATQPPATAAK
jgi:two-component system sensor histidine kinase/response regulator